MTNILGFSSKHPSLPNTAVVQLGQVSPVGPAHPTPPAFRSVGAHPRRSLEITGRWVRRATPSSRVRGGARWARRSRLGLALAAVLSLAASPTRSSSADRGIEKGRVVLTHLPFQRS